MRCLFSGLGVGDLHRIGAVAVAIGSGVDLFEFDLAIQDALFPRLVLGFGGSVGVEVKSRRKSGIGTGAATHAGAGLHEQSIVPNTVQGIIPKGSAHLPPSVRSPPGCG